MNLTELRKAANKMIELYNEGERAKEALKAGFFGNSETFEQFCSVKKSQSGFSDMLQRFSWERCLEGMSGKMWTNVFASAPSNPIADDIVIEIYRLIEYEECKIIDMILNYDEKLVDEIIDGLKFITEMKFPTEQLAWVRYAAMHRIPETIDYYTEILRELNFLWVQVIKFAINDNDSKWKTKDEISSALTDRLSNMKSKLAACCRRAEEYTSALAWVDEYKEWRDQNPIPKMSMDALERMCETD